MDSLLVATLIFLINIFFGYWRLNTTRLSTQWLMAIHIPIALAIGVGLLLLEWNWALTPIFIAAFIAGQYEGSTLKSYLAKARANTAQPLFGNKQGEHVGVCLLSSLILLPRSG